MGQSDYTVIGSVQSRAVRVMWMLGEVGQPYETIAVGPHAPEILKINPTGKIPALVLGDDTVLLDSVAICQFLADKYATATYPAGTVERARQDGHMAFVFEELDQVLWANSKHRFALPKSLRVEAAADAAKGEFAISIQRLAERLGDKPYLMGETFTVPDLIAAHCLAWARAAQFEVLDERVAAYGKRCRARPAFRQALAHAATKKA
ncbi:MAG: glutathione S-transferase family protein [Pseudomonadota bacterium]